MMGIVTGVVCGVVAGYIMNQLISGNEKGSVADAERQGRRLNLGGLVASFFGHGNGATYSFYASQFAFGGASLARVAYRRILGV
jgi:hypothetical protein